MLLPTAVWVGAYADVAERFGRNDASKGVQQG